MPIERIDLEAHQETDDVIFLSEEYRGTFGRRRRLSSCTIGDEDTSSHSNTPTRLLEQDELELKAIRLLNTTIQADSFLEVRPFFSGKYLVEFILVKILVRCRSTDVIKIRGTPFLRNRSALAKLPKKPNEVCMLICRDDDTNNEEVSDISTSQVVQMHTLLITNTKYPNFNRSVFNPQYPAERGRPNKLEVRYAGQGSRRKQAEESVVRIDSSEVSRREYRISNEILRNRWRGTTVKGGSWNPFFGGHLIDLESERPNEEDRSHGQQYTIFDSCSGAGGVSRGALMAGFKVRYALDKAPEVWDTYQANFPETELFKMSLDQFLSSAQTSHLRVDVLHFSPPCQFFSPAHTHASEHDDANIFALYGCNQLLKKLRPRIVTVEQTFGLTHDRHEEYFNGFLGDFTQHGYSIRWRVIKLCTWGAAQDRRRLIIIAAAPGERLPTFPQATHNQEGGNGLLPYNSIGKALRGIRAGDDLHDLDNVHYFDPPRAPYDPERLAGTITTGGSDFYHPDGSRKLTLREYASLQGFPKSHQFLGTKTSIKRQIGNAFPPNTVRVLYKHLEQWLLNEDHMKPFTNNQETILIEDDSDTTANLTDDSENRSRHSPDMMDGNIVETFDIQQHRRGRDRWAVEDMVIDLT
ncbi:related to cytosine C5-DNA methyltransferase [Fusarium fujikuroi IMI 58289]|uniref:DNA (cytosine-5-)-methyltransferase n=1 Tax=Gibberella fujikuroi (strain CBS 195.34 / IMI 58289 / NRRL A-6831) TaxID=1279085 RepID=S0ECU4_GIBF5|nr:related to cytosine C5-DNA methyltransferase [Fusarium fujikuroi IMI 58289]SCN84698.1 related to cytosine C5-DNA methyltransferase [Fusarium fujikuroi]CCT70213.1 related to cytosine C5-DNA methyltransferase [Fusarium fujikuroi IMI 58289]SCO34426.1 related to cytosine C5-DNA methyltransferase [Fusarium fujikuroi]SCO48969.1 related to cytosine C5-DNA methyltransferase [Fusarium fujikuroi]SCV35543.1 related to cytosine C5-DNA methyltransferase [Fusarium fujikuroi]